MLTLLLLTACSTDAYQWSGGGTRYSTGHNYVVVDTGGGDTGDTGGGSEPGRCGAFNGVANPEDPGDEGGPDVLAVDATMTPLGSGYQVDGVVDIVGDPLIGGTLCVRINGEDGSEAFTARELAEPGDVSDNSRQAAYENGEITFNIGNLSEQNYAVGVQVADAEGRVSDYLETNVAP